MIMLIINTYETYIALFKFSKSLYTIHDGDGDRRRIDTQTHKDGWGRGAKRRQWRIDGS